jgi:uncharacterized protein YndB with AHSA1/START domain
MPSFEATTTADAAPEDVWKLLYDPTRFPEWWVGIGSVESDGDDDDGYTMYPTGYPDYPMPQLLSTSREQSRVEISCLISDLVFAWQLRPVDEGKATEIRVHVEIPETEADRLPVQIDVIRRSLTNLAELAGV